MPSRSTVSLGGGLRAGVRATWTPASFSGGLELLTQVGLSLRQRTQRRSVEVRLAGIVSVVKVGEQGGGVLA